MTAIFCRVNGQYNRRLSNGERRGKWLRYLMVYDKDSNMIERVECRVIVVVKAITSLSRFIWNQVQSRHLLANCAKYSIN